MRGALCVRRCVAHAKHKNMQHLHVCAHRSVRAVRTTLSFDCSARHWCEVRTHAHITHLRTCERAGLKGAALIKRAKNRVYHFLFDPATEKCMPPVRKRGPIEVIHVNKYHTDLTK